MAWLQTSYFSSSALFPATETDAAPSPSPATPWTPRPNQTAPPGDWLVWLILAGRGWGKTRAIVEWLRTRVQQTPLVNVIGPTADDVRDVLVEGPSGVLAVCDDADRPRYEPAKRRLAWPNGARSLLFSAEEPERLRGKQHHALVCDELAAWRHPEAWHQALFGLRLGSTPQAVVATTPRPTPLVMDLAAMPTTHVTTGTSYENREHLSDAYFATVIAPYEGTRLGEQEIHGRILTDVVGALWTRELIRYRVVQ